MIRLSERLMGVYNLITPGLKVADIGCDHGYLSIHLIETERAVSVIASDLREGPLSKARDNVSTAGLDDKIELRLSDGLENIKPGEAESIVMSGMGGNLMMEILEKGRDVTDRAEELILQPQSEVGGLRHYLEDNGFVIISEAMVYEDSKYYPMMKAVHGEMNWEREIFFRYGKILLRIEDPVLHRFLIQERDYYVNLYSELCCQNPTERVVSRLRDVENSLALNNEALELIETPNVFCMERTLI